MTKFVCRELIYDYLTGNLDTDRRLKFQEFLGEDNELKQKLDRNKHSLRYIGELKKVELSEVYQAYISETHGLGLVDKPQAAVEKPKAEPASENNFFQDFWEQRPELAKLFRRTGEALALAAVVFLIVTYLPKEFFQYQDKSDQSTLILTDSPKEQLDAEQVAKLDPALSKNDNLAQPKKDQASDDTKAEGNTKSVVVKAPVEKVEQVTKVETTKPEPVKLETKPTVAKKKEVAPVQFYLYRSVIYVEDMVAVSDEFVSYLEKAGAKKAGKVKLGWEKRKSRYFHFHIDENLQEEMLAVLKKYAPIRLNRYDHWRKTPENKIRAIIEIRQKVQ